MLPGQLQKTLLFILLLLAAGTVSAQQKSQAAYTFEFRGESMIEVLDHIARQTEIDLVYDPELVRNITVYKRLQQDTISGLLTRLLEEYQLDYITLSSGTVVIVRSPRSSPSYGVVTGKIVDAQTGDPLPGASVMLADASGGTSTNRSGNFSMNRLISGSHHIIVSYLGYESAFKTIDIKPNEPVQETILLTPKPVDVSPLIVEAHRPRMPGISSSVAINPDSDLNPQGMMQTPIRNLNLVPGIQYGLPMQDLHIQGSSEGEHRILLDGVPVYNPYSFGQMFSAFSPFAIGNVKLHKAGYGVQEGSQMAGLINLSSDLSYSGVNTILFQGDPLSLNLRGDMAIPLKGDKKIHTLAAIRSSFWDIYRSPALNQMLSEWDVIDPLIANQLLELDGDAELYTPFYHDSDVRFVDFHAAAGYEPDKFSSVSASLYLAENAVESRLLNQTIAQNDLPRYLHATDSHSWTNVVSQLQWNRMVTPRLDLTVQAAYSENRFTHFNSVGLANASPFNIASYRFQSESAASDSPLESLFPLPTQIDGNRIQHFLSRADLSYSLTPTLSLDAGIQADRVYSEVDITEQAYLATNTSQSSSILSTYLNSNHTFSGYWRISYGSRFTYLSTAETVYAEPRFSIQYDQPQSDIGYWSFRIAGGLYRQFINDFRITNTGAASVVPDITIWSHADEADIPKSYHLTGSLLFEPAEQTTITLEGFYKWQPVTYITSYGNLITGSDLDRSETAAFANSTEMSSMGAGIRLNHEVLQSKIRLIAGYDYSYSRIDLSDQFGRIMPTPWNEPHRAQFRTLYRVNPNFTILAKWQGIWGRSWAYRQSYYNYLRSLSSTGVNTRSFENPQNDLLRSFQQVDLSFIYRPNFGAVNSEIRIELINLLNRRNEIEKYLLPVFSNGEVIRYETENRELPGFYPSVSVQLTF
jgi:hypothetical protein